MKLRKEMKKKFQLSEQFNEFEYKFYLFLFFLSQLERIIEIILFMCGVRLQSVCQYTNNNNFSFCLMKKKREEINCEIAKIAGVCQHSHDEWRFCSLKRLIKFNYFGRIFLKRKRWGDDVDEVSQSKDMEQTKTEIHPVSRLNPVKMDSRS